MTTIQEPIDSDDPDTGSVEKHETQLRHISGNTNALLVRKKLRRLKCHWYGADIGWATTDEDAYEQAMAIPEISNREGACEFCQYPAEHDLEPAIGGKHHIKHIIAYQGQQSIPCRYSTEEAPVNL